MPLFLQFVVLILVFVYLIVPLDETAINLLSMTLADLLLLLSFFMQPVTKESLAYDFNGDGFISTADLILLLAQMG